MEKAIVSVKNISKSFLKSDRSNNNSVNALNNISFSLNRGDSLGIIGKNGAGKTTLLNILASIIKPTNGSAILKGKVHSLIQIGNGFHPDLSGLENLKVLLKITGVPQKEQKKVLDEIIDFSELYNSINNQVKTYSSGMYVRLAFSLFTHIGSDILLIDEILSVGDGAFLRKSFDRILQLKQDGTTFIIASHDIERLEFLCNKGLYLKNGNQLLFDSYKNVYNEYVFELNKIEKQTKENVLFSNKNLIIKAINPLNYSSERAGIPIYHYEEDISFEIEFELLNPIDGFDFGLDVTSGVSPVFFNSPLFFESQKKNIKPGAYKRICIIPKNFLFSGFFSVSIWAGNTAYDEVVLKNCLNFQVKVKEDLTIKPLGHVNHPILPNLNWNLEVL